MYKSLLFKDYIRVKNLTLVIPAKKEAESLTLVLKEIEKLECTKIIITEENDIESINAISNFDCKIIFQDKKGYGDAIIKGINSVYTEYLCIFNADGSFDPKYLLKKLELCKEYDYIFSSRYMKNGGSEDDTLITKLGNFIFSLLGNILFSLKLSDILFTYILGKTQSFRSTKYEILFLIIILFFYLKKKIKNLLKIDAIYIFCDVVNLNIFCREYSIARYPQTL